MAKTNGGEVMGFIRRLVALPFAVASVVFLGVAGLFAMVGIWITGGDF